MIYEYNGNLVDGLYYFYASWNSKCNVSNDRLKRIDLEFKNLNIITVNTTKFPNLKKDFTIKVIPTYLLFKNNQIIKKIEGNIDYISLAKWLK